MYLIYFNTRYFIVFIVVSAVTTRQYRKIEFSFTWKGGGGNYVERTDSFYKYNNSNCTKSPASDPCNLSEHRLMSHVRTAREVVCA